MAAEKRRVWSPCDENASGFQPQNLPLTTVNGTILCDVSNASHRPFISLSSLKSFLLAQPIAPWESNSRQLVTDRFIWPEVHRDLKAWAHACLGCPLTSAPFLSRTLAVLPLNSRWAPLSDFLVR
uniref:Transposon Ty3-I Gag-Pol polyprotein n=1 Tax=Schistocephalus solidus TaxID=70667 RepID=A0A0V0J495_SCHSO